MPPALSQSALQARYLVPFVPLSAQRAGRQPNHTVARFVPGSPTLLQRSSAQIYTFLDRTPQLSQQITILKEHHLTQAARFMCLRLPEDFKDRPKRKARRKKSRDLVVLPGVRLSARRPDPEMIKIPKNWFELEYFKALRKVVRGPISKGRRTMATLKAKVPKEVWHALISEMKESDVTKARDGQTDVTWEDGEMQPTKTTSSTLTYDFVTARPMVADRLLSLERADLKGVHGREGKGAWRRGLGCAALKLSDSPKKGAMASAFAMVGGNVTVKALVPTRWRAWPTVILKFWILTVDHRGNILWPTNWSQDARDLLKEMAKRKVAAFKADASYPIRADFCDTPGAFSSVLSKENSPRLDPPTTPLALPAPQ